MNKKLSIKRILQAIAIIPLSLYGIFSLVLLLAALLMGGIFLLAGLPILLFETPGIATRSWQDVTVTGIGTFRVPAQWNVEEHDGILFITDRPMAEGDYAIYIVGTVAGSGIRSHEVFEEVERGDTIRSRGFHNFGDFSLVEYTVNGVVQEHYFIILENPSLPWEISSLRLFVWNREAVDSWHVQQITRTFSRYRDDFDERDVGLLER